LINESSASATENETEEVSTTKAPAKSSEKMITIFDISLAGQEVVGQINQKNYTISVEVPEGINVTSLKTSIVTSPNSTISPASGDSKDFSKPVAYKVTAEDGTEQNYQVTVKFAQKTAETKSDKSVIIGILVFIIFTTIVLLSVIAIIFFKKSKQNPASQQPQ